MKGPQSQEHSSRNRGQGTGNSSALCNRGIDRCVAWEQLSPASPQCQLLLQQGRYRSELRFALEQHLPSIQERDVLQRQECQDIRRQTHNLKMILTCLLLWNSLAPVFYKACHSQIKQRLRSNRGLLLQLELFCCPLLPHISSVASSSESPYEGHGAPMMS